jgi:hypothetical protein
MKIDTDHLHHWMQAIRKSSEPMRTMDAFWSGQIKSKEWLINQLSYHIKNPATIEIHGGWVGVLSSMLFQDERYRIQNIVSVDIDPHCQFIAEEMNQIEYQKGLFRSETDDMCNRYPVANTIINTSCEHISQDQYNVWLSNMRSDQLLVLQSNNYNIPEHIRVSNSIGEFLQQSNLSNVLYSGPLELPLYNRYMIIGYK